LSWRIDRPGRRYRTKSTTNVSAIGTNPSPMTPIWNARSSLIMPMRLGPDHWAAQCSLCHGTNYDRADPQICMRSRKGHPRRVYRVNIQIASGMVNMLEMTSASATILVHSQTVNVRVPVGTNAAPQRQRQNRFRPPLAPASQNQNRDSTGASSDYAVCAAERAASQFAGSIDPYQAGNQLSIPTLAALSFVRQGRSP
jgi:hypothetical protein